MTGQGRRVAVVGAGIAGLCSAKLLSEFGFDVHVYDRTLTLLRRAVDAAKLGNADRLSALRELDRQARECERYATTPAFDELVARERAASPALGGRSV